MIAAVMEPSSPPQILKSWCQHAYREYNKVADGLAIYGIVNGSDMLFNQSIGKIKPKRVLCHFDGGFRKGVAASGVVIQVCFGDDIFIEVLRISVRIGNNHESSSLDAELYAAQTAIIATIQIINNGFITVSDNNKNRSMDFINFDGKST